MGESPDGICRAVCSVVVVPTGHLALILVAMHVWGDAKYGLVGAAVAEAAPSYAGTVLDLVVGL